MPTFWRQSPLTVLVDHRRTRAGKGDDGATLLQEEKIPIFCRESSSIGTVSVTSRSAARLAQLPLLLYGGEQDCTAVSSVTTTSQFLSA